MAAVTPQRRPHPHDDNSNQHRRKVHVLTSIPQNLPSSTTRMSQDVASDYGLLLSSALSQHVAAEPPHACTFVALGRCQQTLAAEVKHFGACEEAFVNTKLRELLAALLGGLCGIRHPNSVMVDNKMILPRKHFTKWLVETFNPHDIIFGVAPSMPENSGHHPLEPITLAATNSTHRASPTVNTKLNQRPASSASGLIGTLTPSPAAGVASRLRFSQLNATFDLLLKLAPQANEVTHSLTVSDVVRVLTHARTAALLSQDSIAFLVVLVESIVGCTIKDIQSQWDSSLARKSFKAKAREFRTLVSDTVLVTRTKNEWTKLYTEQQRAYLTDLFISEGRVVSMQQVRKKN